jgi:hypothetical protein
MALSPRRNRSGFGVVRGRLPMLFVLATALVLSGCNYLILAGYLIGGPPSIEPDFDKMTNKSMTDLDVTVAVVCYAPTELKWDFDQIDNELAKYISFQLRDHKIQVISPDYVRAWLDENPDWDKPEEIGAHFNTTYVIYIDLHEYSLYEENSANLYRGRAEGLISVYEMDDDGNGERIYSKEIISKYPRLAPRSTSEVTHTNFKRQYLSRLSDEIGRLFYEYYAGDNIPYAS